jgi:hypothetical protein
MAAELSADDQRVQGRLDPVAPAAPDAGERQQPDEHEPHERQDQ